LGNAKYAAVRTAFEHAFEELDATQPHTKDAVRSIFESLEILVKQMVDTQNLNEWIVKNSLKDKALNAYGNDPAAKDSIGKMFDGFAQWVNSIHNYRHGQEGPEPVAPSIEFAVYALSSGAAFLRWLVDMDSKNDKA
ncbi:MAG: hypothetical protein HZA01_02860, partial [Nitrospinae bacterium]|nr:hypothetical protein [Nitrospinota bacterium]